VTEYDKAEAKPEVAVFESEFARSQMAYGQVIALMQELAAMHRARTTVSQM
jgi:hypothetical protein